MHRGDKNSLTLCCDTSNLVLIPREKIKRDALLHTIKKSNWNGEWMKQFL